MGEVRTERILAALAEELRRQAGGRAPEAGSMHFDGAINLVALAQAVDLALGGDPNDATAGGAPGASAKGAYRRADEGKTPDELNASNDDGRG